MKPSQMGLPKKGLWGLVLVIGLCAGLGLYASVATAHEDGEGTGDFSIGNDGGRGGANPPPGGGGSSDPGGLEADPDTFSVDSRTVTLRDVVRFEPWVSQDVFQRSLGWILRLTISKILAAW